MLACWLAFFSSDFVSVSLLSPDQSFLHVVEKMPRKLNPLHTRKPKKYIFKKGHGLYGWRPIFSVFKLSIQISSLFFHIFLNDLHARLAGKFVCSTHLIDHLGTSLKPRYPKHEGDLSGNTGRLKYDTSHTREIMKSRCCEKFNKIKSGGIDRLKNQLRMLIEFRGVALK